MAIDFSAFDNKVDLAALQKEVEEAKDTDFADVPDGKYIVSIEKMEIKLTKAQDKLMFAVQCKIKEGEQANRMIFFNRVISGNKVSETWNDGRAIKSVCTWVNELLGEDETPVEFINYQDLQTRFLMCSNPFRTTSKLKLPMQQASSTLSLSMRFLTCKNFC